MSTSMSTLETTLVLVGIAVGIFLFISAIVWVTTGEKGRGVAGLERPDWEL